MATTIGPKYDVLASELDAATTNPAPHEKQPQGDDEARTHLERHDGGDRREPLRRRKANGSVGRASRHVEYPLTNWKYCVMRKMNPKRQRRRKRPR